MRPSPAPRIAVLALALALGLGAAAHADPVASFQQERAELSRSFGSLAGGLEGALRRDDVGAAERLFLMERQATRLLVRSGELPFPTEAARLEAQAGTRALLQRILTLQERVQQHAIAELDRVLPGEPPQQAWARSGSDLYRPLFRLGTPKPNEPARTPGQALQEMTRAFLDKGGKPTDFRYLGKTSLKDLPSGELAEWVQFGGDRVRFTTAGAKHPVIGQGRSVRGAGSLKVYKDRGGDVLLAVVSNSSGNYKPGTGSTEGPVQKLIELGVPESHILVTSVIPGEPELVKLLLKSKKTLADEQIKARVAALRAKADGDAPALGRGLRQAAATQARAAPQAIPGARARLQRAGGRAETVRARPARVPARGSR